VVRKELNLGILAHVDAGKTTLTERLLYEAGVLERPGSVDRGTTLTDSLALERRRGITIRSAVASFAVDDVHVNLIDTPGHPDFIAEVERVLNVLDGAVLVISAVEGVQPQTRILFRALQRLRVPTLLFVNKIDRMGADADRVLGAIESRLTPNVVAVGMVDDGAFVPFGELPTSLGGQQPVFFGSAITGAGVDELRRGIVELLPAAEGDADAPLAARVFTIERGTAGERIAYVRLFSGRIGVREKIGDDKITSIAVFEQGGAVQRPEVSAGGVAKLWGLDAASVGDRIGAVGGREHHFAPPTVEAVVAPLDDADAARLRVALAQLAEQDPLIDVRQDDVRRELSVSLYGEVQKEVIEATLADDYGIAVEFRETTPLYVERPTRSGEAIEPLHGPSNPTEASLGFRLEPGDGVEVRFAIKPLEAPLHLYGSFDRFKEYLEGYIREALRAGRFGWTVTDCVVTVIHSQYGVADGPPSKRANTKAIDFRKLTPLVLGQALTAALTVVCEPTLRVSLEVPAPTLQPVLAAIMRNGGTVETPSLRGDLAVVESVLPAVRADELQRELPRLTSGEGVLERAFEGYRPVDGEQPVRRVGSA
jgi:ribosomal protection tetracycline resistance protein